MAEKYHESGGTEHIEGFHPQDLYAKIGSSYEIAVLHSLQIG
jgi:hypothetical protein